VSPPSLDCDKRHACRHVGEEPRQQIPPWRSNPAASRQFQFFDFLDSRNRPGSEGFVQVTKMILEVLERLPLRPMIRVIVQVAEEHSIVFLPISEFCCHRSKLDDSQAVVCCFLRSTDDGRTQQAHRAPRTSLHAMKLNAEGGRRESPTPFSALLAPVFSPPAD
jgi:hypothetical protein